MTFLERFASGTAAAWAQILVNMSLQVMLVPLYLSHWNQVTYGVWLAIQATIGLTKLVDLSHQNLVGNEFLKAGDHDRQRIRTIFYSSLPIAVLIGSLELMIVGAAVAFGVQQWLFGLTEAEHRNLLMQAGIVLIIEAAVWLVLGCCGGIVVRVLAPFGYYPRMAWWGVAATVTTSLLPALAVLHGSDLLGVGVTYGVATCLYCVPQFHDIWRILKKERLEPTRPDWAIGLGNLAKSLLLTTAALMDTVRLQGIRLMLSPLVGVADMAAFATMRTGANVALQSLGTVMNPLMPELMRFLGLKDQERTEAAFGFVWMLVMVGMCPAVLLVQWLAPTVFEVWTRGKFHFDPMLFAMLSVSVLIYALAQPAVAIVQGNNLLRSQVLFSTLAGATVIGGLLVLVPLLGIRGAAMTLIVAEAISLIGFVFCAASWLQSHSMRWPTRQFTTVAASVVLVSIGMARIALYPHDAEVTIAITLPLDMGLLALYWSQFPAIARVRVASIAVSWLPARPDNGCNL